MKIFKPEISIDGVSVIVCAVMIVCYINRLGIHQDDDHSIIVEHTQELKALGDSISGLANTVDVLATLIKERTGKPVVISKGTGTPRSNDNDP